MTLSALRAQLERGVNRLQALRALETRSAEESAEIATLVNEIRSTQTEINNLVAADEAITAFDTARNTSAGRVSGSAEERSEGVAGEENAEETRSIGEMFTQSDEYRAFQASNNSHAEMSFTIETRALQTAASSLPSQWLRPDRIRGIDRVLDRQGSLRDVLLVGSTTAESLEFYREDVFTNNAAFVGEATAVSGSSGTKPESNITYARSTATVGTIAHYIPITNQFEWAAPELRSLIDGRLLDGLNLVEDVQLLDGDGSGSNPTGLLNTSGIQVLDNTYFGTSPVTNTGTDLESFERILRAKRDIQFVGRSRATFVVLNPADQEEFITLADANGHYYSGSPFSADGFATLWGLQVVVNENMPEGEALVGDGRYAQIWDRMQARIAVGLINDQFIRNMKTILAEKRVGLAVYRPKAFAHVTL